MASFFDEIAKNNLRSILLMIIFTALFAGIIYLIVILLGGGLLGFIIGIIVVLGYALFAYFMGDKLVLKVSKAKEADRKQYPTLYNIIEGLSSANQIPMPKVYIIDDPNPNAFATGKSKKKASIAVTSGLLAMMDKRELEGVIAHEISHITDNDIKLMMIAVVYAGAIGLFAAVIRMSVLFGFGGLGRERGNAGLIVLIALVIGVLAPIFALLIRLAISRRREYMADANGARITRDPASLADALKKIQGYSAKPNAQPVKHANEITASLYFSSPLKAQSLTNLLSTHPPIQDRIDKLEHMY